nr:uncharacterized protein LOC108946123 [Nicotiana tomentosiformis]
MDFFSTVTVIRSSLNDSTGVQSQRPFTNTLSSLGFTFILAESFPEEFPHEEKYWYTVVNRPNFYKLWGDMEQVESDFEFAHFKVNWEHLHYIYFSMLIYFVESSPRIVHLDKWFAPCQRRKDIVEMPRHVNIPWRGISDLLNGKFDDSTVCKYLKGGYHNKGVALQLNFTQSFVCTMLGWSVIEYGANYEAVVELNHVNDIIIAVSILLFIPVLLWPMVVELSEFHKILIITTTSTVK